LDQVEIMSNPEAPPVDDTSAAPASEVPAGFAPHTRKSPLTEPWEPLYARIDGHSFHLGVKVREAHCNGRRLAHGGLISALADNAMGLSVHLARNEHDKDTVRRGALTVSLSIDYLGTGQIGQWLEVIPRVLKVGGSLAFTDCLVQADGKTIARGNATFRIG
jgi:acyl-coenzyme A thioesterase PaaI-like protein